MTDNHANISVITTNSGYLCKEFFADNGTLSKETHGNLYSGSIETRELSLSELKTTIEGLTNKQALCIGSRKPEFSEISKLTTLAKVVAGESIARSKDYLEFNDKPAFMLFDYDDKELSPKELHTKFIEFMPEFKNVGMLLVPSSSAGVHLSSDAPPDLIKSGCHIYIMVEHGADIPAIGALVKHRAWLAGLGFIKISKCGSQLERYIFDDAVYSPERLIFDTSPSLNKGVEQVARKLILIEGGTLSNIDVTLTEDDLKKQKNLIDLAKTVIRPEAGRIAKAYDKALTKKYVAEGMTQSKAEKNVSKRRNGILTSDVVLRGRVSGLVTVGQIIANPEAYLNDSFIDPEETEYGTNFRAKPMWCAKSATDNTKVLKIRSFASGEKFYTLEAEKVKPLALVPLDHPIPDFIDIAPHTRTAGKNLVLLNTLENLQVMCDCYGMGFVYDVITRKKHITFKGSRKSGDLANDANFQKLRNLCTINGLNPNVCDGINELFFQNETNPVLNYIHRQEWDGKDRIKPLFETLTLKYPTDYNYGFGIFKTWLIQCVASIDLAENSPLLKTGIARKKFESVFILVSLQGDNKTDWLERLTPLELRQYFNCGTTLKLDDKDSVFDATSFWIVELGELDATFKKSDIAALKAFLSKRYEKIRQPYDKVSNEYPRRTSFCATVNVSNFLQDDTGNRRYLPLEITHCDKNHDVDMRQVWSQVWHEYLNGVKWWFDKDDEVSVEVKSHQDGAMNHDPIIEEFVQWYGGEPLPDDSSKAPHKKYTIKQLVQAVKGDKALPNGTRVKCEVNAREMDKLRAYLTQRGFKSKKSDGLYKFDIISAYESREFERQEQARRNYEDKINAEKTGYFANGEPY